MRVNLRWRRLKRWLNPGIICLVLIGGGLAGGAVVAKAVYDRVDAYAGVNPTVIKVRKHLRNLTDRPVLAFEKHTSLRRDPAEASELPKFLLRISDRNYHGLLATLPAHPNTKMPDGARKHWKAHITPVGFEGVAEEEITVKARFRGNGSAHWFWPKRSWRIKFGKDGLFQGIRRMNLVNPESVSMLNDTVATWLAARIGLVTPQFHPVKLYVNGDYHGLYLMGEQPDEHFLQRHDQPVGNVYAETDDLNDELYTSIHAWRKLSVGKGSTESDFSDLQALLTLLNHPDDGFFDGHIAEILDVDAFLRWQAISEFFLSYHQDHLHNNRLYNDPTDGRFRYFVWDIQAFHPYDIPPQVTHPLVLRVLENPAFRGRYDEILAEIAFDPAVEEECLGELERLIAVTRDDALADRKKGFAFSAFERVRYSNSRYLAAVEELRGRLTSRFEELRSQLGQGAGVHVTTVVPENPQESLEVEVRVPPSWTVELGLIELCLSKETGSWPAGIVPTVSWDANGNGHQDPEDPAVGTGKIAGDGKTLSLALDGRPLKAPQERVSGSRRVERFFVAGVSQAPFEVALHGRRIVGTERIALESESKVVRGRPYASRFSGSAPVLTSDSTAPAVSEPPRSAEWGPGPVRVAGIHRVPSGDVLVIRPGTTVELEEGASIFVQGTVVCEGTAAAPIVFGGVDGAAWGVVALLGDGASGSRFAHTSFEGGGESRIQGVLFTGMLALHHTNVPVRDSIFRRARGDDAINCKHWNSVIERCVFEDNGFDSIDVDFSHGTIRNCRVLRSGNDGIDLGTAQTRLVNLEIRDCGDKGISFGERSEPPVVNCLIEGNQIGFASKDLSEPHLVHCTIVGNRTGVALYRKKLQYGGGRGKLTNCIVLGNQRQFLCDDLSAITVRHSCLEEPLGGEGNIAGTIAWLQPTTHSVSDAGVALARSGDPATTQVYGRWTAGDVPMGRLDPGIFENADGTTP